MIKKYAKNIVKKGVLPFFVHKMAKNEQNLWQIYC